MLEKRRQREEDATSPVGVAHKKRRVEVYEVDGDAGEVGATELASALALASLAGLRTTKAADRDPAPFDDERRDAEYSEEEQDGEESTASTEMRSPKEDPVPVTPEVRSPIRQSKKVTFAPDIKDHERLLARRQCMPPRIKREAQASRMPQGFRGRAPAFPTQNQPQLPMPWMRQRMMAPPGFMPPPTSMMPPMNANHSNQWICDFCNVASFATFHEACVHEETCQRRCNVPQRRAPVWHPMAAPSMPPVQPNAIVHTSAMETQGFLPSASRDWYQGSMFLSVPGSDSEWLSELNCFVRSNCVEAFSATEDQVNSTSKRGRITFCQVGIRCHFCAHRHADDRAGAAISFPSSVSGIYESVKRWQRVHLQVCEDTPPAIRQKVASLSTTNVWIPTTRQYWADSARALGMVDTEDGIRFAMDPNRSPAGQRRESSLQARNQVHTVSPPAGSALTDGKPIVYPEDMNIVPPYVYFLMSQVESCHFTEADRFVARSKGPVGYPGFECRHCNGHAGLGKYFPVSSKSLSTNSTSQNIHAHLLKCRKCPPELKHKLAQLKEEKSKAPRLEPGWRKVFFDKLWERMHGQKP